ncbi:MAG: hypothetical protein COA79_08185 [Planctomycetota bacterium]|nr:MAG: hypothetical protein COA79_08185 [Planctomycetota bacterium]
MSNELLKKWNDQGYCSVKNMFTKDEAKELLKICNRIKDQSSSYDLSLSEGRSANSHCMRHLNHPGYFENNDQEYKTFMNSICDDRVMSIVNTILDGHPYFRCTSYFFDQQEKHEDGNWHRDSQFGIENIEKEKEKILADASKPVTSVQMQIALEPSEDIEFVPTSQRRWDTNEEMHIRLGNDKENCKSNNMPNAMRFKQEPGDMIAFNPFGLHRGRYHTDKTRRTLMLTFSSSPIFDFFTDQPWFINDEKLNLLPENSKAFYQGFIEIFKNQWIDKHELAIS